MCAVGGGVEARRTHRHWREVRRAGLDGVGRPGSPGGGHAGHKRGRMYWSCKLKFGRLGRGLKVAVNSIGDSPDDSHVHNCRQRCICGANSADGVKSWVGGSVRIGSMRAIPRPGKAGATQLDVLPAR